MLERVVEIAGDSRHLSAKRGFLIVSTDGNEIARVPLDDIAAVLVNGHGATYTNDLLVRLAGRGASLIICDRRHQPVAWLWPMAGNHIQVERMQAQLNASVPLRKRMWQSLIRGKIRLQAALVGELGGNPAGILRLAAAVRSGDPTNVEAQAARRYWPAIMGADFRRNRSAPGANALLNYGYTILRSAVARSISKAGLHPSIGVHHHGKRNAFCLVDDVIEPFRPVVDRVVIQLTRAGIDELTRSAKSELAGCLITDLRTSRGRTPVARCADRLAFCVAESFLKKAAGLDLPNEFVGEADGDMARKEMAC